MGLITGVTLQEIESIQGGMAEFYTPQSSDETMVVKVPANTIDDLFVHKHQTDQLLVVRGSFVLVVLYDRQYQYIPLSEKYPQVVTIPKGILHGAINLSDRDCLLVNAVLRHGEPHEKDYQPIARPFPYDLEQAKLSLENLSVETKTMTLVADAGI
ncbi:MAG: dTDP-4-dehydrorhamnose 3,5-epimerase [Pleurocapsa sp. MO_226.B13]|nr:dTDP-4-dehydrorhamnose 3,5-epimerase [Pleurocapsa sp. MO_226.B13]